MPVDILMPALSPTMEEGNLAKWLVKEGDRIKAGDVIAEIETDKATMEVEAVDEGVLSKILIAAGTQGVKVNTIIAQVTGEDEPARAKPAAAPATAPMAAAPAAPAAPKATPVAAPIAAPAAAPVHAGNRVVASPLARRMAEQAKIDLSVITGTGPGGRIVKADIERTIAAGAPKAPPAAAKAPVAPAATPAPAAAMSGSLPDARIFFAESDYEAIPHDNMRKAIAKRLTIAKRDIPHFYLTVDCAIDALLEMRKELNAKSPKDGAGAFKLSVNDFIVRACALSLMKVPGVNASWTDTHILRHKHAHVGVAVALDFGLITPIVARADTKGLAEISNEVKQLAERARAKKLKPQEYEGGTFAISNLGMMGIRDFTAVINPPHSAILAIGAGEERPVIRNGAVAKATMMTVRLSCDHRVIDGALGAEWLRVFKGFIEDPVTMML